MGDIIHQGGTIFTITPHQLRQDQDYGKGDHQGILGGKLLYDRDFPFLNINAYVHVHAYMDKKYIYSSLPMVGTSHITTRRSAFAMLEK